MHHLVMRPLEMKFIFLFKFSEVEGSLRWCALLCHSGAIVVAHHRNVFCSGGMGRERGWIPHQVRDDRGRWGGMVEGFV